MANKINLIDTSYEIVCATLRRAPSNAYLELEDHPAINVAYTFSLEIVRNIRIEKVIKMAGEDIGYRAQDIRAKVSLRVGAA